MIIALTGFMGCGKSSVGRKLSTLLSCSYADLDDVIEADHGRTIPEIFATDGEPAFRQMELNALLSVINSVENDMVLSLGGGTVMTRECAELIRNNTRCIYLKASVDTLLTHLEGQSEGRPMLTVSNDEETPHSEALRQRITDLMSLRASTYEKTAHITIDTDGRTIEDITGEILESIR